MTTSKGFDLIFQRETTSADRKLPPLYSKLFLKKNWGLLLKESICSQREQILSFKSTLQWEGSQIIPCHLFPLEVYQFHLMSNGIKWNLMASLRQINCILMYGNERVIQPIKWNWKKGLGYLFFQSHMVLTRDGYHGDMYITYLSWVW